MNASIVGRRVGSERLIGLQEKTSKIRNICILAHVDHGKTTLSDSLVCSNGIISAKLAGKIRFLDSTEDEQKRGITMHSSAISLLYQMEQKKSKGGEKHEEISGAENATRTAPEESKEAAATPVPSSDLPPPPPNSIPPTPPSNQPAVQFEDHLINLIDSPGHIDFSSDVSTATRLCDGALVVVDVIEGVCIQTHAVLRQAWVERMRPCLVLNKLDRLITELQLTPLEAFTHLRRVLENVNAVAASLVSNEMIAQSVAEESGDQEADGSAAPDVPESGTSKANVKNVATISDLEKWWEFSPELGNVVFASAVHTWAFSLRPFAKIWAQKIGCRVKPLMKMMWGDYAFSKKKKKVVRLMPEDKGRPMFVSMILDPIWQLYEVALVNRNADEAARLASKLGLEVPKKELMAKDYGPVQAIFRRWLPLADAVLRMVVDVVPSPLEAQQFRAPSMWSTELGLSQGEIEQQQSPEMTEAIEQVYDSVASCNKETGAPIVIFVSKMIPMRRSDLRTVDPYFRSSEVDDSEGEIFIAFARIFSGTLTRANSTQLFVLGPKYHPAREFSARHMTTLDADVILPLYMMMGNGLLPVEKVHAGNLVAIAGLERFIFKCGTLTSTPSCPGFKAVTLQAKPLVRVAVEVVNQKDISALEKGLQKLFQADPAVEVSITESGEHIVAALGELHMSQCLKDLRERYARVDVHSSQPIVTFRESIAPFPEDIPEKFKVPQLSIHPWMDMEEVQSAELGKVRVVVPSGQCAITLQCIPLSQTTASLLDNHPTEAKMFLKNLHEINHSGNRARERSCTKDGASSFSFSERFLEALQGELPLSNTFEDIKQILVSFGPRNNGPNILFKSNTLECILVEGEISREIADPQLHTTGTKETNNDVEDCKPSSQAVSKIDSDLVWDYVSHSVISGFQLATAAGPLFEESMYGVCFKVEKIEFSTLCLEIQSLQTTLPSEASEENKVDGPEQDDAKSITSEHSGRLSEVSGRFSEKSQRFGPLSGQIISTVKDGCRAAFISCPARLVEAYYCCELQCDQLQLGNMYAVLSKRRGRVTEEDIVEGTQLFILKAVLPVAESFGFANELLKKTSGAATTPQLAFSHWEIIDLDPFFRPTTEEEREDLGEIVHEVNFSRKYIDAARKRKGLARDKLIVVAAEKQRTLTRNK